jgi:hypothetical protein
MSITLSDDEANLVVRAIDAKLTSYAGQPPEVQEVFLTPYVNLRAGIMDALDKAQRKSSSSPAPK